MATIPDFGCCVEYSKNWPFDDQASGALPSGVTSSGRLSAASVTVFSKRSSLGGGNVKKLKKLPPDTRLGSNENAFRGGFELWNEGADDRRFRRLCAVRFDARAIWTLTQPP